MNDHGDILARARRTLALIVASWLLATLPALAQQPPSRPDSQESTAGGQADTKADRDQESKEQAQKARRQHRQMVHHRNRRKH
jgi:Ni/Co efflux regulator RcnB